MSPLVDGSWIDDEPSAKPADPAPDVVGPAPAVERAEKPWWLKDPEYDRWTHADRYWSARARAAVQESDGMVKRIWVLLLWIFWLPVGLAAAYFLISMIPE